LNEAIESERRTGRDMVVEIDGLELLGVPIKLSRSPAQVKGRPPQLGEHTEAVLTSLGHTVEEISEWRDAGVI
jgi:crotonobetainyl-CoA:carnitine CoA-transferase CaiB-like acyl-CoA transferase